MKDNPEPIVAAVPEVEAPAGVVGCYQRGDWLAFGLTAVVALAVYGITLAPTVTFENAGELLTAAHCLGVLRAPGHPAWTILAWLWQRLIPFGSVAWRVNLMSAWFGALTCGYLALLVSRSGRAMVARMSSFGPVREARELSWLVLASAVTAGLLLAFSPVMWSQSVVTQVNTLDAFCLLAMIELLYRWSVRPQRRRLLYLAAMVWGVGLTSQPALVLLAVAVPLFIGMVDRELGRDVLVPVLILLVIGVLVPESWFAARWGADKPLLVAIVLAGLRLVPDIGGGGMGGPRALFAGLVGVGIGVWAVWRLWRLWGLWGQGPGLMRHWRQVLGLAGAVLLGASVSLYEPLASATNPPLDAGYTRSHAGLVDHITQGHPEMVQTERPLLQCWGQLNLFFNDLQAQFGIVFALLALVVLFYYRELDRRDRDWLRFALIAFLWLSLGFLYMANPTFEKQQQLTARLFFLPAHCLYALWIGYGLLLGAGQLLTAKSKLQAAGLPLAIVVGLVPVWSLWRNWSGCEQRHHDFGYQYGHLMFEPGGAYPAIERGAVLYGGTDSGRSVPAQLIFVESPSPAGERSHVAAVPDSDRFDRRDVYLVALNSLVDPLYLRGLRDEYGADRADPRVAGSLQGRPRWQQWILELAWRPFGRDQAYPPSPIWLPSDQDWRAAVTQAEQELPGRPFPGTDPAKGERDLDRVTDLSLRLAADGILARMVFENNKDRHSFYIEASNTVPWMEPYLEPHGIVFKLNPEPLAPPDPAALTRDREYWRDLAARLLENPRFRRDNRARRAFASARAAIGNWYMARGLTAEAADACQQALALSPESAEATLGLASLDIQAGQYDAALEVLQRYQKTDPYNLGVHQAIAKVHDSQTLASEASELEKLSAAAPANLPLALQLAVVYARLQRVDSLDKFVATLLPQPELSANELVQLALLYPPLHRLGRAIELLTTCTQRFPQNPVGWYYLAVVQSLDHNCPAALANLTTALSLEPADGPIHTTAAKGNPLPACQRDGRLPNLLAPPTSAPLPPSPASPFSISR